MSSRRRPQDLLKTSSDFFKTFSGKCEGPAAIDGLSIYVSMYVLELFTYYHSITRQTELI